MENEQADTRRDGGAADLVYRPDVRMYVVSLTNLVLSVVPRVRGVGLIRTACMMTKLYVRIVITSSRVWSNRVMVVNPARGELNREKYCFLCPLKPREYRLARQVPSSRPGSAW